MLVKITSDAFNTREKEAFLHKDLILGLDKQVFLQIKYNLGIDGTNDGFSNFTA